MQEFIGQLTLVEIPSVFWDVCRVGPSTGLPTRTQQSDITMLYEGSHGDTQHIVLFPGTVEECFEFGWRAFDYTEKFQTPVFGMSDLDLNESLGMFRLRISLRSDGQRQSCSRKRGIRGI